LGLQPLHPGDTHLRDDTDMLGVSGEKALEAAKKAALEIKATLERKDMYGDYGEPDVAPWTSGQSSLEPEPPGEANKPKPPGGLYMGVVKHWAGIRGFGILRSQAHGEIFVHAKSLVNASELVVGDIVTFELGFDWKKQKPEAVNCLKAGAEVFRALHTMPQQEATWTPEANSSIGGARPVDDAMPAGGGKPVDDAMLAGAAAAAAKKLLAQGMGGAASADGEEERTGSRHRRRSPSSSEHVRRGQRRSSRGRPRRSRSRSRQAARPPRQRR